MTDFVFDSIVALDPVSGFLSKDTTGQVYAEADLAEVSPLPIRDAAGVAKTSVKSGPQGLLEVFITTDQPRVWWVSGGFKILLTSPKGFQDAAEAAASAAIASANAADAAARRAVQFLTLDGSPAAEQRIWAASSTEPLAADGALDGDLWMRLP